MPRPAPTSGAGFDLSYIYLYVLIFFFLSDLSAPLGRGKGRSECLKEMRTRVPCSKNTRQAQSRQADNSGLRPRSRL